ncbi:MAG: hypothetical protein KDI79_14585 [Anaerolineae bacterium]|nr:hypothetical protein [Anaerolineae bacterium]
MSINQHFGGIFRWSTLGYSEFQGDEVKALVPAAEALEGQAEALFYQRKKGPGEIVVPILVWSMTGLICFRRHEQSRAMAFCSCALLK